MPDVLFNKDTQLADGRIVPAGTVVKNAPVGITREQLLNKLNKDGTGLAVAGRNALSGVVNTLMAVPDLMLNASARAVNDVARFPQAIGEGAAALRTGNFDHMGTTPPVINRPPLGEQFVMPRANDVYGMAQVMGENLARSNAIAMGNVPARDIPAVTLEDARANQRSITDAGREQFPMSAMLGDAAGGAASLVGLRSPIAAKSAISQLDHVRNVQAAQALAQRSFGAVANSPKLSSAINEAFKRSTTLRSLGNRAGRAAEVGFEGATLAFLNGGDPLEIAAYGAGGQAAGSLLLGGISIVSGRGGLGSKGLRLMGAAAGVAGLIQLVKTATPGGENSVIESVKSGFEKVTLGLALGAISGLAGTGRVANRFPVRALPELADAITAIPRGAAISVLNEALKDKNVEKVVDKLRSDPNYFGTSATNQINRALFSEKVSLSETIHGLMSNDVFSRKMEEL